MIQLKLCIFLKTKDKSITNNIFRIQSDNSIICTFYCTVLMENMIAGNIFLYQLQKKDKIIYKYFKDNYDKRKRKH